MSIILYYIVLALEILTGLFSKTSSASKGDYGVYTELQNMVSI